MGDNLKIAVNSIIIFIRLCIMTVIGVYAARIVLDVLGASDYGLYNVVGGVVTLLNVVTTSMTSTTYRYIAYELGKGKEGNTNKVFNASFMVHCCFALLIVVLGYTVGDWYVYNYVNLPEGRLDDALFVFHISVFTAALSTLLVPYKGLLVAFENFTVSAIVDIIGKILYILAVIFILKQGGNKIRVYGIIQFILIVLEAIPYLLYSRAHFLSTVKFHLVKEWSVFKGMLSFSVWTLYGALSSVGRTQGSVLLINYFFGTLVNAAYAVAQQVNGFIKSFALSLNNAAVPQITKSFSGGKVERSITLASYISKYTFILMSIVAFPVMLDIDFLLGIWLKEVPEGSSLFCQWLIITNLVNCLAEGIYPIIQASGRLAPFQIVGCTYNLLGLPATWIAYKLGAPPEMTLVIFFFISFTMIFIRLIMVRHYLKISVKHIIITSYWRIFLISVPCFVLYLFYHPSNFSPLQHFIGLVCVEIFLIIDIVLLGIDKKEKALLKPYFLKMKKRLRIA